MIRRRASSLLAVLAPIAVVHAPTTAATDGLPVVVDLPGIEFLSSIASTTLPSIMSFGTATDASAGFVDIERGVLVHDTTTIDGDLTLRPDGETAWRVTEADAFEVVDLGSGAVTEQHSVPWTTDWTLGSLGPSDPSGRYVALSASSGVYAAERGFVFDLDTDSLVTPDPVGVGTGTNHSISSISTGAATVTYTEWAGVGLPTTTMRWTRATGQRTVAQTAPVAWSLLERKGTWVRRETATGDEATVPVDASDVVHIEVHEGGRVVLAHVAGTAALPNAIQLSAWDGSGPMRLLSRGADGQPADWGIDAGFGVPFVANEDASSIAFMSFATNLPPTLDDVPVGRRLFVSRLPTASPWPTPAAPAGKVQPGEAYCMPAIGAVAGDVIAVNVTPVRASAQGFGTMHPSGGGPGATSNVNFRAGSVDPNLAFVEVGADGRVCFSNSPEGPVDVVVDELLVADRSVFSSPTADGPARVADTRKRLGGGPLAPGERRCVTSNGDPGDYVAVNVTPVRAGGRGFGTLHSSDDDAGDSSTVNFDVGTIDPNLAIVEVGADRRICFTNSPDVQVDLILDELSLADPGSFTLPTDDGAARLADTRRGLGGTRLIAAETRCWTTVGTDPGDWVAVNATPVRATGRGFGTLHSSDDTAGNTSNVNVDVGTVDPNLAIVQVGADGRICFTNSPDGPVDLVIDQQVNAAPDAFDQPSPSGAHRLTDTRAARH